jgi:hypothetical protein
MFGEVERIREETIMVCFRTLALHLRGVTGEKSRKLSVRILRVSVEIRTGDLLDTSQKHLERLSVS